MTTTSYIFLSILCVSLASFSGLAFLSLREALLKRLLPFLVSFAVGALFANVFLHLLPEMVAVSSDIQTGFLLVLAGIIGSFILERFIHWHHCHNLDCSHAQPVGTMMLIGDGFHNITDGILIAAAYLVDIELGIATTLTVILHEIPQEIGDFAVLLHGGWSRGKALLANFASALTAILGGALVLLMNETIQGIDQLLLPLIAGNFIYIAGSDLVPALHKERSLVRSILQALVMVGGIALMYLMFNTSAHGHAHSTPDDEHDIHEMHMDHMDHDEHLQ